MRSLLGISRRPDVTFYADGHIDITARVAQRLRLMPGDVIDVAVDEVECCLYVRLRANEADGRHEARVYPTKPRSRNYRAHSKRLCTKMLAKTDMEVLRLPAGETVNYNGQEAVSLISAFNLDRKYNEGRKSEEGG